MLDAATLEVRCDYTRVSTPADVAASLTLPLHRRPGSLLPLKLCQYLRPKVHPAVLDCTLNSHLTVCLNIYQVGGC